MNQFKIIIFFCIALFLTSGCGFKVVEQSSEKFTIKEITSNGDKRINFRIKNDLQKNSIKNSQNNLKISFNTKKIKNIKEKNIKNEITKYGMQLNVELELISKNKLNKISFSYSGDYLVGDNYSKTISNEKNVTKVLTDKVSERIVREIGLLMNDN